MIIAFLESRISSPLCLLLLYDSRYKYAIVILIQKAYNKQTVAKHLAFFKSHIFLKYINAKGGKIMVIGYHARIGRE